MVVSELRHQNTISSKSQIQEPSQVREGAHHFLLLPECTMCQRLELQSAKAMGCKIGLPDTTKQDGPPLLSATRSPAALRFHLCHMLQVPLQDWFRRPLPHLQQQVITDTPRQASYYLPRWCVGAAKRLRLCMSSQRHPAPCLHTGTLSNQAKEGQRQSAASQHLAVCFCSSVASRSSSLGSR